MIEQFIADASLFSRGILALLCFPFRICAGPAEAFEENRLHSSPPIDNKDKPGQDRDAVFEEVQRDLNFRGQTPTDSAFFIGDWTCTFSSHFASWDNFSPDVFRSFFADGAAPGRAVDGTWDQPKDRWKFNEDQSFSDWTYIDPMPEYGIDEPTYSEDRYHVLIRSPDKFVLFNGDGSLVMIYSRAC